MKYQEFREKNPDFQSRVEAFTSGLLTPDTKGIALWSMKKGESYGRADLYGGVKEFCDVKQFPLTISPVWGYCIGSPSEGREGSLYSIGAVVKMEIERQPGSGLWAAKYQITDAGEELGKPLVARSTAFVNMLEESRRRHGKPKFCSMTKIMGFTGKPKRTRQRRGYGIYLIVKTLVGNYEREFGVEELSRESEMSWGTVSHIVTDLGNAGVIFCEQPTREFEGKRPRDWARYEVKDRGEFIQLDPDELYEKSKEMENVFVLKIHLISVINLIKNDFSQNIPKSYTMNSVSESLKIRREEAARILSFLRKLGYLDATFVGQVRGSRIKANQFTGLLWEMIYEPLEAIATSLDLRSYPDYERFMKVYQEDYKRGISHRQTHLEICQRERTRIGKQGGEELRNCILQALTEDDKKLSWVVDNVNAMLEMESGRRVNPSAVRAQLKNLIAKRLVEKTSKGFYRLKQSKIIS